MGNSIDDDEEWYKHPHAYFTGKINKKSNWNCEKYQLNSFNFLLEVACDTDDFTNQLYEELASKLSKVLEKLGYICNIKKKTNNKNKLTKWMKP